MMLRAGPEHAAVLAAVHATSFAAPWEAREFETLLSHPGVVGCLFLDGLPEGFILVRAAADEAEILTLAVIPKDRRRGVASKLMHEAIAILRSGNAAALFLEVAADNVPAIGLYTRHGFAECGRRPDYYSAGRANGSVDAIVMKYSLTNP